MSEWKEIIWFFNALQVVGSNSSSHAFSRPIARWLASLRKRVGASARTQEKKPQVNAGGFFDLGLFP